MNTFPYLDLEFKVFIFGICLIRVAQTLGCSIDYQEILRIVEKHADWMSTWCVTSRQLTLALSTTVIQSTIQKLNLYIIVHFPVSRSPCIYSRSFFGYSRSPSLIPKSSSQYSRSPSLIPKLSSQYSPSSCLYYHIVKIDRFKRIHLSYNLWGGWKMLMF